MRESLPRLQALRNWMAEARTQVLDKGPMGQAIDYAFSNWAALVRYVEDGRLPIDNNAAERAIRRVAIGRKNWLFLGSETGGRSAAIMMSLLGTCWANQVNSWIYLKDVLDRLPTLPAECLSGWR